RRRRGEKRIQTVVLRLARKAAVQNERAGEGEDQPEQAAGEIVDGLRGWVEGEDEQHRNKTRQGRRSVESTHGRKEDEGDVRGGGGDGQAETECGQGWSALLVGAVEPAGVVEHFLAALARVRDLAPADESDMGGQLQRFAKLMSRHDDGTAASPRFSEQRLKHP